MRRKQLFMEIYVLHSLAPCSVNRDDMGDFKVGNFGFIRRGRISSQCLNYTIRDHLKKKPEKYRLAKRTRRFQEILLPGYLKALFGDRLSDDQIRFIAELTMKAMVKKDEDKKNAMMFVSDEQAEAVAKIAGDCFLEALEGEDSEKVDRVFKAFLEKEAGENSAASSENSDTPEKGKKDKKEKQETVNIFDKKDVSAITNAMNMNPTVDQIYYGRMFAGNPSMNINGVCSTAHAITTHEFKMEYDEFTATDEVDENPGAGHIDSSSFGSGTFYKYRSVDITSFCEILQERGENIAEIAADFIPADLETFVQAVPSGKQHSFASWTSPCFVMVAFREGERNNLANAFERPVSGKEGTGYEEPSIEALANRLYSDIIKTGIVKAPEQCFWTGVYDVNHSELFGEKIRFPEMVEKVRSIVENYVSENFD